MGDHFIPMGDAEKYLLERYGLTWSRSYIRKLIREGKLRGVQPTGQGGWWYLTRESIDELLRD